jgi:hypothetical protein
VARSQLTVGLHVHAVGFRLLALRLGLLVLARILGRFLLVALGFRLVVFGLVAFPLRLGLRLFARRLVLVFVRIIRWVLLFRLVKRIIIIKWIIFELEREFLLHRISLVEHRSAALIRGAANFTA